MSQIVLTMGGSLLLLFLELSVSQADFQFYFQSVSAGSVKHAGKWKTTFNCHSEGS